MTSIYHDIKQMKISKKTSFFWKYNKNTLPLHGYCGNIIAHNIYYTSAKYNCDCEPWGYLVLTAGRAGM